MSVRRFNAVIEWDADFQAWVTFVPLLNGLSTFGETREEAIENTREAILGYLEAAEREGLPVPEGGGDAEMIRVDVAVA